MPPKLNNALHKIKAAMKALGVHFVSANAGAIRNCCVKTWLERQNIYAQCLTQKDIDNSKHVSCPDLHSSTPASLWSPQDAVVTAYALQKHRGLWMVGQEKVAFSYAYIYYTFI
jgi:hypothetical protein